MTEASQDDSSQAPHWQRALMLAVMFGLGLVYFPINQFVSGGFAVRLPLDDLIPLRPIWAIPYLLSIAWWLVAWVWAAIGMNGQQYRAFFLAMLVMLLTSYVVYLLCPTYVIRPEVTFEGWRGSLMRLIYSQDQPYNALPSGHTYNTALITIFWWKWKPRLRALWVAILIIVMLATLFTKQHYILDPLAGLVWALGSTAIANWLGRNRTRST